MNGYKAVGFNFTVKVLPLFILQKLNSVTELYSSVNRIKASFGKNKMVAAT